MRYIETFLHEIGRGHEESSTALQSHLHWGLHPAPSKPCVTAESYAAAGKAMSDRCIDIAGIHDGERVLDAGCGFGGTLNRLHERLPNSPIIGLNIDERQIDFSRENLCESARKRVILTCGDACNMPFANNSFDAIIALELTCHLEDATRFFHESRRVLKPGGRLVIADHVVASPAKPVAKFVDLTLGRMLTRLYGRLNCTRAIGDFAQGTETAGLTLEKSIDVTANIRPNYAFLRKLMHGFDVSLPEKRLNDAISLAMETATRIGAFRYALMTFTLSPE